MLLKLVTHREPMMRLEVERVEPIVRRQADGMPMVLVPAGEFLMGITDEEYEFIHQEFGIPPWNERPQRRIYLDAYYIDQFAVSNQQFCAFLNAVAQGNTETRDNTFQISSDQISSDQISSEARLGPLEGDTETRRHGDERTRREGEVTLSPPHLVSPSPPLLVTLSTLETVVERTRAFHPVSRIEIRDGRACPERGWDRHPAVVPWNFARQYAEWLGCSLPTEAQWEKAARGIDGRRFPWGDQIPGPNGFLCNLGPELKEIDCCPKGRSPYGCFNMSGNVWEWCLDFYRGDFYAGMPDRNPANFNETDHPAYRGGGFPFRSPYFHRTTVRAIESAEHCNNPVGFRCVRALPTF